MRTIYFLRNAAGEVLYIGCTYNLAARIYDIRHKQKWWTEVRTVRSYEVPEERAADEERDAIAAFRPRHNIKGVSLPYVAPIGRHTKPNAVGHASTRTRKAWTTDDAEYWDQPPEDRDGTAAPVPQGGD